MTWIALLVGCADDPAARDPCAQATCSGHGACVASGPNARCECESGWEPVGLACVESSSKCDPDAGPTEVEWSIDIVSSDAGTSQVPTLAIDSAGAVHVTFHHRFDGLVHASDETGAWLTETVGVAASGEGLGPSIALDGDDVVHVACESSRQIVHFVRGDEWSFTVIDSDGGHAAAIALDANGHAHVAYEDSTGHVAHATDVTGAWTIEQVEPEQPGKSPAIAIDSENVVHIAYTPIQAAASIGVRYGTRDAGGTWSFTAVDEIGGSAPSLALDADDRGVIAFGRGAVGELFLVREADGWAPDVIVDNGFGSGVAALALDGEGFPHVAFLDVALGPAIALATKDAEGWRIDLVEDGPVGAFVSAATAPDFVAIVYRGDAAGAVHVARTDLPIAAEDDCPD